MALDGLPLLSRRAWGQLTAVRALRARRFDLAVNLYEISTFRGMLKMAALFAAAHPRLAAGRDTDGRGFFYSVKSPDSQQDRLNHGEHYARLAALLGCKVRPEDKAALWITDAAQAAAAAFLARHAAPDTVWFGVNPGSTRKSRLWRPERFAKVADALAFRHGMRAVITGGPGEGPLAAEIAAAMKSQPAVAAERLAFEESLALIQGLRLLVTTHSSLMHAANAFDVPFVALCGISDMNRDGPYHPAPGRYAVVTGTGDKKTSPSQDEASPAMLAITEPAVIGAAEELLRRTANGQD